VLTPDDWEVWRRVRLEALAGAPEAFASTLSQWQSAPEDRWRQRLSAVPFNVVAVVDGMTVGQASGTELDAGRVELISVWVAPGARGTGVGDALIAAVKDYAGEAGANVVRLSVRRRNEPAIRLYERSGFVASDEPGDAPDEIRMDCPLRR